MANNLTITWNVDAFHDIRTSPGVRADLERRGRAVLQACGGTAAGYAMSSYLGSKRPQGRWQISIYTATPRAMASNAKHNTLVRNFGAARG